VQFEYEKPKRGWVCELDKEIREAAYLHRRRL
jgi:hypothetical protein